MPSEDKGPIDYIIAIIEGKLRKHNRRKFKALRQTGVGLNIYSEFGMEKRIVEELEELYIYACNLRQIEGKTAELRSAADEMAALENKDE